MTHRYTLLVGGNVLPGAGRPPCTAIAWAEGVVLVIGSDEQVRSASRGDSEVVDLRGAFVVPIGPADEAPWPPTGTLEVGGPADLAILARDPRTGDGSMPVAVAVIRDGHAVRGSLPLERGS